MNTISFGDKLINILIIAIWVTFPFVANIALISPDDVAHPIIALNLSLADLLIGLAVFIWIIKVVVSKKVKSIQAPVVPILIFLIVCVVSLVNAFSVKEWAKEMIQFVEYFLVYYILLVNNLHLLKPKVIIRILLSFSTLVLLVAFYQRYVSDGTPYLIRGFFENRNILGTYLCMVVPLIFGQIIYSSNTLNKLWMASLMVLVLSVLFSGSALLSIFISLLIMSVVAGRKILYRYLLGILLIGLSYTLVMPEKNIRALTEFATIYEEEDINSNYYRRLAILKSSKQTQLYKKQISKNSLVISTDLLKPSVLSKIKIGDRYREMAGVKHIKNHYLEMQAALNLTAENSVFGCGLGNYQTNIGKYYDKLPKVNTSEPNQHNGYLVLSSTTGILGLAAFLLILVFYAKLAYTRFHNSNHIYDKGLYIGLLGSVVAVSINNLFCVLLVATLMVPLVTVFALLTFSFDT